MGSGTIRIGGVCGLISAGAAIPAYLAGSPERPRTPDQASAYFADAASFVTANGTVPLLHLLFGLAFLGVLLSLLRSAAGPTGAVYTAVVGGTMFIALTAAGLAAEVAVPAAIARSSDVTLIDHAPPFLTLAVWLYHYSHIGSAALVFATAYVVWRTGVLPRWSAGLAVLGILPLLHTWVGLPGAYSMVAWIGLTGLLMLAIPPVVRVESVVA
ncbi:hypothetical protein AU195_01950 [Mycobacterium sp. IS-1496]|uniref:hypothetical protein n=1 Tax=Mycobacterium sp. IS-1496 TaxID=1772284 RepID=UPI00074168F7|nr:hypothetical protein [Mycobacterium sp. IS-1496]KUI24563.1 hypothetical protein AU195_01950 [Mycobacterium sp. IS-1496]